MGQDVTGETPEERSAAELLQQRLPQIPYRLIVDLLEFIPVSVGRWNAKSLNVLDWYGYFSRDRWRTVFLLFKSFFVVDFQGIAGLSSPELALSVFPLRSLYFGFPRVSQIPSNSLARFSSLRRIEGVLIKREDCLRDLASALPALENLRCSLALSINARFIDLLNSQFSHLKSLSLVNYIGRRVTSTSNFCLTHVKKLRLSGVLGGGLLSLESPDAAASLPQLEELRIVDCSLQRCHFEFLLECRCLQRVLLASCTVDRGNSRLFWEVLSRSTLRLVSLVSVLFQDEDNPYSQIDSDRQICFFTPEARLLKLVVAEESLCPPPAVFCQSVAANLLQLEGLHISGMTDDLLAVLGSCAVWESISMAFRDDFISEVALRAFEEAHPTYQVQTSSRDNI